MLYNSCVKTLKTYDFTISAAQRTFSKSVTDILNATEIIMVGFIHHEWTGWNALNINYNSKSFTIQFSAGENNGNSFGGEIVRVLYT